MIYVYRDGKVVPKHEAGPHPLEGKRSMNLISDIEPFVSVVDWTVIGSRADRREHNKRNKCIDIGSDPAILRPRKPYEPTGVADDIRRAIEVHS
ncbi:MAG: hypothetical protein ACR2RF_26320 [Geminicoccaceae bacterium]